MSAAPDGSSEDDARRSAAARLGSLCPRCEHVKIVRSQTGSTFLLCKLSTTDARFPKYPPQPVARCDGYT
jgi:hypothetical protein